MKRQIADAVLERAAGHCEACHWPGAELAIHHRKLRSRGGRDEDFDFDEDAIVNLLAVHPACHDKIHGHSKYSERQGFMVKSGQHPRDVPVRPDPGLRHRF